MTAPESIGSLFEAPEPSVIGTAVEWCVSLVSGPWVTAIATVAVAGIGFALLAGRMPVKRAALVVVGIFLMAGAGSVVRMAPNVASDSGALPPYVLPSSQKPSDAAPSPDAFDPYAGASIRRSNGFQKSLSNG